MEFIFLWFCLYSFLEIFFDPSYIYQNVRIHLDLAIFQFLLSTIFSKIFYSLKVFLGCSLTFILGNPFFTYSIFTYALFPYLWVFLSFNRFIIWMQFFLIFAALNILLIRPTIHLPEAFFFARALGWFMFFFSREIIIFKVVYQEFVHEEALNFYGYSGILNAYFILWMSDFFTFMFLFFISTVHEPYLWLFCSFNRV